MSGFATSQWDREEDETRTIKVRGGRRWDDDDPIEVHPDYVTDFDPNDEWEKPTTTFDVPPALAYGRQHASATDWIGPQAYPPPSPYAPPPPPPRAYEMPLNSGPTTEYYPPPEPPAYYEQAPVQNYYEPADYSQNPPAAVISGPHPAFAPTPQPPMQISRPRVAPMSKSSTGTWRKTIPALRRMVGLPVVPNFDHRAQLNSFTDPPGTFTDILARRFSWPPAVLIGLAVGLVAMVVISIVGLGTRAADASRAAHERVVTASAQGGEPISRAAVFVDGAQRCDALPCAVTLPYGGHWITVRADGFETPPSRSVKVGANEPRELHFELAASAADPAMANAPADGPIDPATLPTTAALVNPATPASQPKNSAERAAGRALAITQQQVASARLNINAVPFASVVLDGYPIGQTPRLNVKVKPGPHTIIFVTQDGRRTARGTSVGAGETATVAARL